MFHELLNLLSPRQAGTLGKVTPEISIMRPRMSPYISLTGHRILFFVLAVFALFYCGWEIVYFYTSQTLVLSHTKISSDSMAPVKVTARVYCTNPPHCGSLVVTQNFTGYSSVCGISSSSSSSAALTQQQTIPATALGESNKTNNVFQLTLCFTGDPVFTPEKGPLLIPGVTLDFSAVNPGKKWVWETVDGQKQKVTAPDSSLLALGVVEIMDPHQEDRIIRVVNLDSWQIKSTVVGQRWTRDHGTLQPTPQLWAVATQYEGKRASWRATLLLQVPRFVDLITITNSEPGTRLVWAFTGAAGAAWSVWMLASCLEGVLRRIFPGPAQIVAARADAEAEQAAKYETMKK